MSAFVLSEGLCDFCQSSQAILPCDLLYRIEDISAHYFCLLFSSGLCQSGGEKEGVKGFLPVDIRKELRRGSRLKCVFCKKKGATVGCAEPSCKKSYHSTCGARHDCLLQYFGQFKSLCSKHRVLGGGRRRPGARCSVCGLGVGGGRRTETVLSPCCDAAQHRSCLQSLAITAGRQNFRCPNCDNGPVWLDEMLEAGLYVPETEGLTDSDKLCNAKLCFCPEETGRAHHTRDGPWEILMCETCSLKVSHCQLGILMTETCLMLQGIHAKCGGLDGLEEPMWHCYTCRESLREQGMEETITLQTNKLWSKHLQAISEIAPQLADRLQSQQTKQKKSQGRVLANTKYDYTTSFTDLLGSLLDRDESPGDSDYESGDKLKMAI